MNFLDPFGLCPEKLVATVDADGKTVYECPGGGGVTLPGIVATAPRGGTGGSSVPGCRGPCTPGAAGYRPGSGGGGGGGGSEFTPTANNPAPGVFLEGFSDAIEPAECYQDPICLAAGGVAGQLGPAGLGPLGASGPLFRPGGLLNSKRYLRIGVGRFGSQKSFRISGELVGRFKQNPHINIKNLGPWGR